MEYKLQITKFERNPKYCPKHDPYQGQHHSVKEEAEFIYCEEALIVMLKEEEFTAIKKAVIEVIK